MVYWCISWLRVRCALQSAPSLKEDHGGVGHALGGPALFAPCGCLNENFRQTDGNDIWYVLIIMIYNLFADKDFSPFFSIQNLCGSNLPIFFLSALSFFLPFFPFFSRVTPKHEGSTPPLRWAGWLLPTPVPAFDFDQKKNSPGVMGFSFSSHLQNAWGPPSIQLNQRKRQKSGGGRTPRGVWIINLGGCFYSPS